MAREVIEWRGQTDDSAIPPRVKIRVFERAGGCCVFCTLEIRGKLRPAYDHCISLINGGQNREGNLQLLCVPCHAQKTASDVAEKAIIARKRAKHLGIKKPSRFPGSRDSGWKKRMDGSVVRR